MSAVQEFIQEFWRMIMQENPQITEALEEEAPTPAPQPAPPIALTEEVVDSSLHNISTLYNNILYNTVRAVEHGTQNAIKVIEKVRVQKVKEIAELPLELTQLLYEIAAIAAALLTQSLGKLTEEQVTVSTVNSLRQVLDLSLNYIYKFKLKPITE